MDGISLPQIVIIGLIVLILFGSNKLPVFGQSLGKAIKGFKQGLNEIDTDAKDVSENKQLNAQQNDLKQNVGTSTTKNNSNQS